MIDSLPNPHRGDAIKASDISSLSNAVKKRTPKTSSTIRVVESANGFYMETVNGKLGSPAPPLTVVGAGDEDNMIKVRVIPGLVMNVMPKIGSAEISEEDPPFLLIPKTGTQYVILKIEGTFNVLSGVFVLPNFTAPPYVDLEVSTTFPATGNTSTTGIFRFVLAQFFKGKKIMQNGIGPASGELCDTLQSLTKATLKLKFAAS